ncbi:MAG: glycoside hydrolase family 127 protein [Planctomycetota bacterium]
MNRTAILQLVTFVFSILPAGPLFSAENPAYYIKKDSWQETMYASRDTLIQIEAKTLQDFGKLKELGVEFGPWYTVGPFEGRGEDPFSMEFGPELDTDLSKTYGNGQLKWIQMPGWGRMSEIYSLPGDGPAGKGKIVANYLYRTITSKKDGKIFLYLGSNDGLQVWFNGQKVLAKDVARELRGEQDIIEVELREGRNDLLMKINNRGARHAFYFAKGPDPYVKRRSRERLWELVERDFSSKNQRQEMRWEQEDRIWENSLRPDNIREVADRYAKATVNIQSLSQKAEQLAETVEHFEQLKDVREIYYSSKRYNDQLLRIPLKMDLLKKQVACFSKRWKSDAARWRKYKAGLANIEAKANKIIKAARMGGIDALEQLSQVETELEDLYRQRPAIPDGPVCREFNLNQVRLLDGPFKTAMELDRKYLYDLDADRLLHMFRVTADLPSTAERLGGWEKRGVRGQIMGHYLSACALMYAGTGDEKLKAKADYIIAELAKCQQALGNGYLGALHEDKIKRVIYNTGDWWAPWYVQDKILAGLIDMYNYCGNKQALDIALKMVSWAKGHLDNLNEAQIQRMLEVEYGGMNETLCDLYMITKNPDHLALAKRFDHKKILMPLANFEDRLKGLHANTQIPKVIGAACEYEITKELRYYNATTFFWPEVVNARTYCTGGTSNHEHWRTAPYKLGAELSPATQETCCTYNMLKLTRRLFTWMPNAEYADYYERALYNSILSTQDPKTGMMMYHVPLNSGHWKKYNTPYNSFWCCTGTGLENHAKYGDSIYFHDDEGLYVNLFIASELNWTEKGVRIRQETNFPEEQGTTLIIKTKKPAEFAVRIRVPSWIRKQMTVRINGNKKKIITQAGTYLTLKQTWKNGDRIKIDMPMGLHLHRMPDDANLGAIMYGPLVLAGELGAEGLPDNVYINGPLDQGDTPANPPIPELFGDSGDLETWIKPVEGKALTFKTINSGKPTDVTLVPYHKLFDQRYAIYWRLNPKEKY